MYYRFLKEVIEGKNYNLTAMLEKIAKTWSRGELTDEQQQELITLAQENANAEYSRADLQVQLNALTDDLESLTKRVAAIENKEEETTTEPAEYPEWYRWDGIGKCPWQTGSKCTHNGKKWISGVENNIWEPGGLGVHETIWKEEV